GCHSRSTANWRRSSLSVAKVVSESAMVHYSCCDSASCDAFGRCGDPRHPAALRASFSRQKGGNYSFTSQGVKGSSYFPRPVVEGEPRPGRPNPPFLLLLLLLLVLFRALILRESRSKRVWSCPYPFWYHAPQEKAPWRQQRRRTKTTELSSFAATAALSTNT